MAGRGRRRGDELEEALVVDLAARHHLARLPDDGAGARALALEPAVEHRSAGEHDGRDVDRGGRHDLRRRGLVAAGRQHDAVERIAVEHFHQRRGRRGCGRDWRSAACRSPGSDAAGTRSDAAGLADALADAFGQINVMAVARREVGARLGDADDRLAGLQLVEGEAEIHHALEIERGHVGIGRVVEPGA